MLSFGRLFSLVLLVGGLAFSFPSMAKKFEEVTYEQVQEIEKGTAKSYITSRGEKFSVGQKIRLGKPGRIESGVFDYIWYTHSWRVPVKYLGDSFLNGQVGEKVAGVQIIIKKIKLEERNTVIWTRVRGKKSFITDFEAAIESGEIVSSMRTLATQKKNDAFNKLKEAKELLDLEVITQDEYDELKHSLTPIIIGK